MQILVMAFLVTFLGVLLTLLFNRWHLHMSADAQEGVQKFHHGHIPRIGGVAVAMGLFSVLIWADFHSINEEKTLYLLLAALPAFSAGLIEDLTKRVGVLTRLLATMVAAGLAGWLLNALLPRLGVPFLDELMDWVPLAWVVTLLAVAGLTNAVNIIDGFNGLATGVSTMMFAAFGYVAWSLGDNSIVQICLAMIGALLGFFVWNYPRGLIFLGDGGAYLVGFILAEVAVLLVVRRPELSPWFCLLVCIYPITEVGFSIYRKLFLRGMSPGVPDALHLHMLVYRRLVRCAGRCDEARNMTARNSATSPYLWGLALVSVMPAVFFWRNEILLQLSVLFFVAVYICFYARIVQFRVPSWLHRHISVKR